jgi:GT2 family glycosyltransferase
MTTRISVVIPAFDAAETVGGTISSVLSQTLADVEVVVVDDGSRDATAAVAATFPVRVVSQENAGVSAARNRGLTEARGELIAFCDADDVLLPRHLEALLATYERHGGIATSNCYWLFPGGIHPSRTRYKGRFPKPERQRLAILEQNFVSTMSLFPKSLAGELGPFDEELDVAEDWDFWLRAIYAGHPVSLQPEPLALYRWGTTSLSADPARMDEHATAVLRKASARHDLRPGERAYLEKRLAGPGPAELGRRGDEALRERRYREAARSYRDAAALCPTEPALLWKARVMRLAPWLVGPFVRSRQLRIERAVGFQEGHVR